MKAFLKRCSFLLKLAKGNWFLLNEIYTTIPTVIFISQNFIEFEVQHEKARSYREIIFCSFQPINIDGGGSSKKMKMRKREIITTRYKKLFIFPSWSISVICKAIKQNFIRFFVQCTLLLSFSTYLYFLLSCKPIMLCSTQTITMKLHREMKEGNFRYRKT